MGGIGDGHVQPGTMSTTMAATPTPASSRPPFLAPSTLSQTQFPPAFTAAPSSGAGFAGFHDGGAAAGNGGNGRGGFQQSGGYQRHQGDGASPTFGVAAVGANDMHGGGFGRYIGPARGHTQQELNDPAPFEGWLDMMLLDDASGGDDGDGGKEEKDHDNANSQGIL